MSNLKGACIIGQSGGPTAVINSTALGAILQALASRDITDVYCCANGIVGILNEKLYDMSVEDVYELELLKYTPSSAFGSCRYKLADFSQNNDDYEKILNVFKKYDVRYFFYIGGNDSMDTCKKISEFLEHSNYECRVIGIPKTIDNDLVGTDHCPGYGSAAKYLITSCMEVYHDTNVYDSGSITVLEIMGRNAGWLTASTAVARDCGYGPDLIYLPEKVFDMEKALCEIEKVYKTRGKCLVAASEGLMDKDGNYISKYLDKHPVITDSFGHTQLGGLACTLAHVIKNRLAVKKVRGIEFSLLQRCASHCASLTDINESLMAGTEAVNAAISGVNGKMAGFERVNDNGAYSCKIIFNDLSIAANKEKKIPLEWINDEGNGLKKPFLDYIYPLIQGEPQIAIENGVPRYARLKKKLVK